MSQGGVSYTQLPILRYLTVFYMQAHHSFCIHIKVAMMTKYSNVLFDWHVIRFPVEVTDSNGTITIAFLKHGFINTLSTCFLYLSVTILIW